MSKGSKEPINVAIRILTKDGVTIREQSTDVRNHHDWLVRNIRWAVREGHIVVIMSPDFVKTFDKE